LIIPFFIMHRGCPHRCVFCNEALTAGIHPARITEECFHETVHRYLDTPSRKKGDVQIAFYGGTFTGMEEGEQKRLLQLAAPFLQAGRIDGIRISTRPDEINAANLDLLKKAGVTTVEIGAQSFDDDVLLQSRRGHTAADTVRSLGLLAEKGFQTGIHLMVGLPGDTPEKFAESVERAIALHPGTVRIHPTVVLRNTRLAVDFATGAYRPLTLEQAVAQSKTALRKFACVGIPVIRLGLQTTREMEEPGAVVAGPYHPAFRTLVDSAMFLDMAESLFASTGALQTDATFFVSPGDISNMLGLRRDNLTALTKKHGRIKKIRTIADASLARGTLVLKCGEQCFATDFSGKTSAVQPDEFGAGRSKERNVK
jgi:histone acetyltransferase (RNA polymerase elongator complex component)